MKRVLLLSNDEQNIRCFRQELVEALIKAGYAVTVCVPASAYDAVLQGLGCKTMPVRLEPHGCNPLADVGVMVRYIRLFRRIQPDVVFCYTIKPNLYGAMAGRWTGRRVVCSVTGTGCTFLREGWRSRLIRMLYRQALPWAERVFFQNAEDKAYFEAHNLVGAQGEVLPWGSGVNLEMHRVQAMPRDEETHFVFVGRVMRLKGIETYLEVACRMRKENRQCRFHVAGAVGERQYAKRLKELEAEGVIIYHGYCTPIDPILGQCHCVVLPSLGGEGVPNALMEGSACGRACIATRVNGAKEVVAEGETGYLCEPGDVEGLYRSMKRFMALPWERKVAMGLAGRRRMEERYDRQEVVKRYLREVESEEMPW